MATSLESVLTAIVSCKLVSDDNFQRAESFPKLSVTPTMNSGTGDRLNDLVIEDQDTLAALGTKTYDLDGGALLNAINQAQTFVRVKAIQIWNRSHKLEPASTATIQLGGDFVTTHLGAAHDILVEETELFAWTKIGRVVTATTADQITITNQSATVSAQYGIIILGTSA